ncbi:DUF4364 family protein [Alkaliphilus serpentinus]|uniref:DUF4364 family protein n=1 Tax=Alkaliphilus serpentinus TaxID=1482731 RepID=A0A833HNS8_9FIRM|nr:DUF4364 family protein [Alkaliphilus serpentinus]KAB3529871.1 DUF4364 family protein [Alkaliphilus serpentinus]
MFVHSSQQMAEKKLLLLYILKELEIPVTQSQITDFVLENDIMNYFTLQLFLGELKESEFVVEEERNYKQYFVITDKGISTLNYFLDRIPSSMIKKVDDLLLSKKEELQKQAEMSAEYIKLGDSDFLVKLQVVENGQTTFNLSLNVASNKQAREICENWRNNGQDLYGKLINVLIID